jgi:curved DNA-binding protein
MTYIDYYKVLGVSKSATEKDIKNAYRKLARKYHPDLNSDSDAKSRFQLINEANLVLSDAVKRKNYDEFGHLQNDGESFKSKNARSERPPGWENNDFSGYDQNEEFSSFFASMFGGNATGGWRKSRTHNQKGQDFSFQLPINLVDVLLTHKRTFNINGENIRITVPAGIENGQIIKIPARGGPGTNGGPNGDLFLTFAIDEHETFKRVGKDLFSELEIDLYTAILGGEVIFESLNGKVKLKIKQGTQCNAKLKLKNKGLPAYKNNGQPGYLQITIKIKMPEKT